MAANINIRVAALAMVPVAQWYRVKVGTDLGLARNVVDLRWREYLVLL